MRYFFVGEIQEDSSFGDLLQGDFVDSYTNLTLKSIFGLGYMRLLLEKKGCKVREIYSMYLQYYHVYFDFPSYYGRQRKRQKKYFV